MKIDCPEMIDGRTLKTKIRKLNLFRQKIFKKMPKLKN
jgi:hypothetical protein